jgi:transposase-like protein
MNYNNIVRLAFTHPDNEHASIRAIARQLDMNPGALYRILLRIGLVTRPPRIKKRLPGASKPGILARIPRPELKNAALADIYDEMEISRLARTTKKNSQRNGNGNALK